MASLGVHCLLPGLKVAAWADGPDVQNSSGWPCQWVFRSWPDHLLWPHSGWYMAVALSRVRAGSSGVRCCWLRLVCARCLSSDGVASAALALRETMALWSLALIATRASASVPQQPSVATKVPFSGVGRAKTEIAQNPSLSVRLQLRRISASHSSARTRIRWHTSSSHARWTAALLHCNCDSLRRRSALHSIGNRVLCCARAPRDAAAASHGLQGERRALLAQGDHAQLI